MVHTVLSRHYCGRATALVMAACWPAVAKATALSMASCWLWLVTMFLVGRLVPVVFFGGFYHFVRVLMMYVEQLGT